MKRKNYFALFLIVICLFASACNVVEAPAYTTTMETTIDVSIPVSEVLQDIQLEDFQTSDEAVIALANIEDYILSLNAFLEQYGDDEEGTIVAELARINNVKDECEIAYEFLQYEELWDARAEEYPVMTQIWLYMKENFGWSDEVCAGIIGNILAEAGGGYTMKIPTKINKTGPYGLCQWLGSRKNYLVKKYGYKATVEEQLEFMYDELYGTDGVKQQVKDSQREKILNASTPEDAAMKFCKWFERPGGTGLIRKKYARKVYDYFVD